MTAKEAYLAEVARQGKEGKTFQHSPELRAIIATSADYAHRYAFHVLNAPIPEAEPLMQTDQLIWDWYQRDTLKVQSST